MKLRHAAPATLWLLSCALGAAAFRFAAIHVDATSARTATVRPAPGIPALPNRARLQVQAESLRARNPFRLARTPTTQAFGAPAAPVAIQQPVQPRPVPSLGGIVGGPPWKALIEGIPGRESGVLLAVGEEWNGFRLAWVRRDSVKLVAPDTTFILALKQAWR